MDNGTKITNVLKQNIELTNAMNEALDKTANSVRFGTTSLISSGVTKGMATLAASSAEVSKGITFLSVAPIAFAAVGVAAIAGGGGYFVFAKYRDDKDIERRRAEYLEEKESSTWLLYFKEEYVKSRPDNDHFFMRRDHEAIASYIKYLEESAIELSEIDNKEYIDKVEKYRYMLQKYIKPDRVKDFHDAIRYHCAYHKIGEFTPKDTRWHSNIWYEREELKTKMYKCFKDCILNYDSPEEAFKNIRNFFYRFHSIVEATSKQEKPEIFFKYANDLEKLMQGCIKPESRKEFDFLFRRYRYLGGKCEFDREKVLNAPFYFQIYGGYVSSNNNMGGVYMDHYKTNNISDMIVNGDNIMLVTWGTIMMCGGYWAGCLATEPALIEKVGEAIILNGPQLHGICGGVCH